MLVTNYDYSELFLFNISTDTATYTNSGGSPVTLSTGAIIGRIGSSNLVVAQVSTATDGSQIPAGILAANYTVAAGASQVVTFAIAGEINSGGVVFGGSDTLTTEIFTNGGAALLGTIKDILQGKGIILKGSTNLNYFDRQGS